MRIDKVLTALPALAIVIAPAVGLANEVTVRGCAVAGAEAGCVVLSDGTTVYNITAAKPAPTVGTAGEVTGTVLTDGASFCMQGTILSPATWMPLQGIACSAAKP